MVDLEAIGAWNVGRRRRSTVFAEKAYHERGRNQENDRKSQAAGEITACFAAIRQAAP